MISHKHKCIFIHISKCAGSSIESAFGIDVSNNSSSNNENLFGWNWENKLYIQHATPQQLLDCNFINKEIWDTYYKFIIIRNPWDRAYSDYKWLYKECKIKDTFINFINAKGKYFHVLNQINENYRGDHLNKQADYFFLDSKFIEYDKIIRFENIEHELNELRMELNLEYNFFIKKINVSKKRNHYSFFYNKKRRMIIDNIYKDDIELFNYKFTDKKNIIDSVKAMLPSQIYLT